MYNILQATKEALGRSNRSGRADVAMGGITVTDSRRDNVTFTSPFIRVELLAAREIGRETAQYVDNIYKYYLSYRRVEKQRAKRATRSDKQTN